MVTACGMTKPEADTITIEYGGRKLSGTANHPMWVVGQGWTPLGEIEEGDELLQWNELFDSGVGNAPANYAELSSLSASTAKPAVAPVRVQRVYAGKNEPVFNLTVDGNHEFIANGLVVHNCDAARYAVFSSRQFWMRHVEAMRDRAPADTII